MCKILEDMRREERAEATAAATRAEKKMTVLRMLADGALALEKIAEYAGLSLDEVKTLQAEQSA